jgi:hypothetical protein
MVNFKRPKKFNRNENFNMDLDDAASIEKNKITLAKIGLKTNFNTTARLGP